MKDFIVLEVALFTGGFTDCMLQLGIKKGYGIYVGILQDLREALAKSKELVKIENDDHVMIALDVKKCLLKSQNYR